MTTPRRAGNVIGRSVMVIKSESPSNSTILTLSTLKYLLYKSWRPKGHFKFENITNVLGSFFCFI